MPLNFAKLDMVSYLPQGADGGRRVENNLRPVQAVHHPVLRVVATVANVDGNPTVFGLEI